MSTQRTKRAQWLFDNASSTSQSCFTWPFHRSSSGHPFMTFEGKAMTAARAMCLIAHGEPKGPKMDASHSCGKAHEGCLNPNHLEWKTHKDNMADRHKHGTHYLGQQNPRSVLTDRQVADIKARLLAGAVGNQIAKEYGVTRGAIYHITSGRRWSHVVAEGAQ